MLTDKKISERLECVDCEASLVSEELDSTVCFIYIYLRGFIRCTLLLQRSVYLAMLCNYSSYLSIAKHLSGQQVVFVIIPREVPDLINGGRWMSKSVCKSLSLPYARRALRAGAVRLPFHVSECP